MKRLVLSDSDQAAYHCMSRCVNRESLLDPSSREILRSMLWKIADFCGIDIITYAIMPNHFHVLVRIPKQSPLSDRELLRRYLVLHPTPSPYSNARPDVIADWLKRNTPEGLAWRSQQLALMNHLPSFMKLLKLRFTRWFNSTHHRVGTLWAERFKSVLVEYDRHTLLVVAAYIDLNAIRKGLVSDPKDYRFCGYSDALAGHPQARRGLRTVCPHNSWSKAAADYRCVLYASGSAPRDGKTSLPSNAFDQTLAAHGQLPLATLLRHRLKFLSDGTALGSHAFITKHRSLLGLPPIQPNPARLPSPQAPHPQPSPWTTLRRFNHRPSDSY